MSALWLVLDASTYTASVALLDGGALVREQTVAMRDPRHERLMPAVATVLGSTPVMELARVVCGAGPGSFTSLRIAASIAKGLAAASGKPLYAVSSLALLVTAAPVVSVEARWLAVLDAMRGESFVQAFTVAPSGSVSEISNQRVVREGDLAAFAREMQAKLVGPARELDVAPHARGVTRLLDHPALHSSVDLATWEPQYGRLAEAQVRWEAAHGRALDGRAW